MKVVHNIQQPENASKAQQLERSILNTSTLLRRKKDEILEPLGLNLSKLNILHLLNEVSPMGLSQFQIRDRIADKTLDLPRIVHQLVVKKYAKSIRHKHNKRVSEVTITPLAVELLKQIEQQTSAIDAVFTTVSDEESTALIQTLQNIFNQLNQVKKETPDYMQEATSASSANV